MFNIQDFTPDGSDFDHLFKDNEIFKIGDVQVKVFYLRYGYYLRIISLFFLLN